MCFLSGPKVPEPPPPPSELAANVAGRREARLRARAAQESGRGSTLLTGAQGVAAVGGAKKTLLGG